MLLLDLVLGLAVSMSLIDPTVRSEILPPVTEVETVGSTTPVCTAAGDWCAVLDTPEGADTPQLRLYRGDPRHVPEFGRHSLSPAQNDAGFSLDRVIHSGRDDDVIVGVNETISTLYSGGGGSASHLSLIRFTPQGGRTVLTLPVSASLILRACFSEQDMKARAGACHDEYDFTGNIEISDSAYPPVIGYRTVATTYPGPVSRSADPLANPPLTAKSLKRVEDPTCTYRRVLTFDPAAMTYLPDTALPDCSDYTAP